MPIPEDNPTFPGCDCPHDPDEHGWDGCHAEDCLCEVSWEE